jgi:hypothetical protein
MHGPVSLVIWPVTVMEIKYQLVLDSIQYYWVELSSD